MQSYSKTFGCYSCPLLFSSLSLERESEEMYPARNFLIGNAGGWARQRTVCVFFSAFDLKQCGKEGKARGVECVGHFDGWDRGKTCPWGVYHNPSPRRKPRRKSREWVELVPSHLPVKMQKPIIGGDILNAYVFLKKHSRFDRASDWLSMSFERPATVKLARVALRWRCPSHLLLLNKTKPALGRADALVLSRVYLYRAQLQEVQISTSPLMVC
jgi:hypothetical protein